LQGVEKLGDADNRLEAITIAQHPIQIMAKAYGVEI